MNVQNGIGGQMAVLASVKGLFNVVQVVAGPGKGDSFSGTALKRQLGI